MIAAIKVCILQQQTETPVMHLLMQLVLKTSVHPKYMGHSFIYSEASSTVINFYVITRIGQSVVLGNDLIITTLYIQNTIQYVQ